MSRSHFPVYDWEPGDPVDVEHLKECDECRGLWEMRQLLGIGAQAAPEPDESPFFAPRVARLAAAETASPWASLERAARQLIPVFASLALLVLLSSLLLPSREPGDGYAELLVEPEEQAELTLDDVLLSLGQPLEEEASREDQ